MRKAGTIIKNVLLMICSFVLLTLMFLFWADSRLSAIFFLLAAIVCNPLFLQFMRGTDYHLPGYIFALLTAVLFYAGCSYLPSSIEGESLEKSVMESIADERGLELESNE